VSFCNFRKLHVIPDVGSLGDLRFHVSEDVDVILLGCGVV
jgi:hypothetical protein